MFGGIIASTGLDPDLGEVDAVFESDSIHLGNNSVFIHRIACICIDQRMRYITSSRNKRTIFNTESCRLFYQIHTHIPKRTDYQFSAFHMEPFSQRLESHDNCVHKPHPVIMNFLVLGNSLQIDCIAYTAPNRFVVGCVRYVVDQVVLSILMKRRVHMQMHKSSGMPFAIIPPRAAEHDHLCRFIAVMRPMRSLAVIVQFHTLHRRQALQLKENDVGNAVNAIYLRHT